MVQRTFSELLNFSRGTGATRVNAAGLIVGVDFSSTSNTIGTGSKTFTLIADANVNRDWSVGENVLVVSQAGAPGTMTGVVTSYTASTQTLVINVPVGGTTGSGTSTDWRIGSLEVRRDANGLVVETAATNLLSPTFISPSVSITGGYTGSVVKQQTSNLFGYEFLVTNGGSDTAAAAGVILGTLASFTNICLKIFVKQGTSNGFRIRNGTSNYVTVSFSSKIIVAGTLFSGFVMREVSNGFFECIFTANSFPGGSLTFVGVDRNLSAGGVNGVAVAGETVFFVGQQFEVGNTPTSYIPTTTTSWTRNADSITFSNSSLQQFRQSQGTIYVDADFPVTTTRAAALSLTGANSEISLARQGSGTTASFTKMVESGNTQLFGSSTAGNLIKNLGKQYEPALGTRNDTGATNTNLAIGLASNAIASSGNGFGVAAGTREVTTDGNLSSVSVRGLGGLSIQRGTWTGSRFIFAPQGGAAGEFQPIVSTDGQSYRLIQSPAIDAGGNDVAVGVVGGITRVVMVGNTQSSGSKIWSSDDQGETWVTRTPGANGVFPAVAFGNNTFVAVANNVASNSRYSTDGITWSAVTGLIGTLTDIIHTGSQFVAINTVGGVFTSTDGITFTAATVSGISPTFTFAGGIAYDNGFYTIVGNGGQIVIAQAAANATSFTFSTFVTAQTGTSQQLNQVTSFNGQFYAVGAGPTIVSYPQSLSPTFAIRATGATFSFSAVTSSPTTLVVTGSGGNFLSSTDGIIFTQKSGANSTVNGIAFGNNRFVSVGSATNGSGYIATIDADGTVTRRVSGTTSNIVDIVYYGGTTFYAITNSQVLVSTDSGVTWSVAFTNGVFGQNSIATNGTQIIISGTSSFTVFSSDGTSFVLRGTSLFQGGTLTPNAIAFGNGIYVFVGNGGLIFTATTESIASSTGGTRRASNTTQNLTSVMYSARDNCWYAAGANGTLLRSDDNAVTWYSVNGAMQGYSRVISQTDEILQSNLLSKGNFPGSTKNKFALQFNSTSNTIKVSANGNKVTVDSNAQIGNILSVVLGENFNGTIREIKYFPDFYSDSELVQISLGKNTLSTDDSFSVSTNDTLQINSSGDTLRIN